MSALQGFVRGFSETMAENIRIRKDEARDFFNKQVEYARTQGLQNRQRVRQTVDASLSVAKQLEAVGVPREVIMAQINQNPEGLGDFYTQAEKIRAASNKELTPEEWKTIYKVSGDFKAPDEDLATFISRTYDPIANAASSPEFSDDPEGSIVASLLGFNAMDKARRRLGTTEIAEGLTADELIRYGDVQPQRIGGNATVVTNYQAVPSEGEELSTSETIAINKQITEDLGAEIDSAIQGGMLSEGGDATTIRDKVVQETAELFVGAPRTTIERLVDRELKRLGYTVGTEEVPVEAPETPVEGGEEVLPTEGSQTTETPSETPSTASTEEPLSPEERAAVMSGLPGVVDVVMEGNDVVVSMEDGTTRRYKPSALRAALKAKFG